MYLFLLLLLLLLLLFLSFSLYVSICVQTQSRNMLGRRESGEDTGVSFSDLGGLLVSAAANNPSLLPVHSVALLFAALPSTAESHRSGSSTSSSSSSSSTTAPVYKRSSARGTVLSHARFYKRTLIDTIAHARVPSRWLERATLPQAYLCFARRAVPVMFASQSLRFEEQRANDGVCVRCGVCVCVCVLYVYMSF
jgi:hypothetical protein